MPEPLTVKATVPAPFWMTPENVAEPAVGDLTVKVTALVPVLLSVTVPLPVSTPMLSE